MKFIDLARKRSSIRSFTDQPVSKTMLNEILEAGCLAPTACNLQPFRFIVVQKKENLAALAACYPGDWFKESTLVIAVCTQPEKGWKRSKYDGRSYTDVDAAIAADHMTLAATDLGLGSCWIGAFDPEAARKTLGVPSTSEPLILLAFGHPNETGRPKVRKELKDLVRHENWKGE